MLCRLCLNKSDEFLEIYNEAGEMVEQDILKVVAKYLQIEIYYSDKISNRICLICSKYLQDFNQFCLTIDETQRSLNNNLENVEIKCDNEDIGPEDTATHKEPNLSLVNELSEKSATSLNISLEYVEMKCNNEDVEPEDTITLKESNLYLENKVSEIEFSATKIEQENKSSFDYDCSELMEPFSDDIDILSKDAETKSNIRAVKSKRQSVNRKQKSATETKGRKKLKKSERPSLKSNNTKKPNTAISEPQKSKKVENLEDELIQQKQNLEAKRMVKQANDEFLAENTELSCCICSFKSKDFKDLRTHFRKKHKCTWYVFCCDLRFTKRTVYIDHLKLHKNPDVFKCYICNKQLVSRKNYKIHMDTKHPAEENLKYECQHCTKKFSKQYILDNHIRIRHASKDAICKLCNKAFANVYILNQHEKTVHRNESEYVCDICGRPFKTAATLHNHKDSVHSTEPRPEVQCTVCRKWLKSERILRLHMKKHRDEAAGAVFKCAQCDAEKKTKRALSSHMLYQHSKKLFPCTMCEKVFKTPIAHKEHEATHTGTDLYTCPFCPTKFRSRANMHTHKKRIHKDSFVRKYAQPNEYTQSVLNQARNTEVS